MKAKRMLMRLCLVITTFLLVYLGVEILRPNTEVAAASYKTYTISTNTKPDAGKYVKSKNYNSKTKHYYMLKSYLELLEKKGGGTLVLKKGVYNITNTLCVPSNVTIKLSPGTVLKKLSSTGVKTLKASEYMFYLVPPSKQTAKNGTAGYKGSKNISIIGGKGATIDMGGSTSSAIFMAHNDKVVISDITFKNVKGSTYIITVNGCKNVKISNCSFSGQKSKTTGILLDIPAKEKKQTKVWVKHDNTINKTVKIINCKFSNLQRGIASVRFVKDKYFTNILIEKNSFKNIGSDVIRALNWDAPQILKNTFVNVGTGSKIVKGATDFARGIYLGGVKNPIISGNSFDAVPLPIMAIAVANTDSELKKNSPKTENTINGDQIKRMYKENSCKNSVLPYVKIYNNSQTKHTHYYFFEKAKKTYRIKPESEPYTMDSMVLSTYNSATKQYYMIQSYLNQIEANGGGTLILSKGTYKIPAELAVGSNTTIQFESGATVQYTTDTKNVGYIGTTGMFSLVSPRGYFANTTYSKYDGAKNIRFVGPADGTGVIDLNKKKLALGIIMCHNTNITIENITFKNMNSGHCIEMDASKKVTVKNCTFMNGKSKDGTKVAINLDMPDKNTGGFIRKWTKYDKTPNTDITITNNVFKDLESAIGSHHYTDKAWHTKVKITNNKFSNISYYPIRVMQWDAPIISGNKFNNIGLSADENTVVNIICMEGVRNPQVFDNVLNKCSGYIRIRVRQIADNAAVKAYPILKNVVTPEQIKQMTTKNKLTDVSAYYVSKTDKLNPTNSQITKHYVKNPIFTKR